MNAPDLVVEVRESEAEAWRFPESQDPRLGGLGKILKPNESIPASNDLVSQLVRVPPSGTGAIPALRVHVPANARSRFFRTLLLALQKVKFTGPSPARSEIQRRLARTPLEVAQQLSVRYGHELEQVVYI